MELRFEQNIIYDKHTQKKYNPNDKGDMKILCTDINAYIHMLKADLKVKEYKLKIIQGICDE